MVVCGIYSYYFPQQVRNHATPRQWRTNPERAEQKQKLYSRLLGIFFFGIGCLVILAGIGL